MEENKTIEMTSNSQPEKMSYEQLENVAHQLSEQNRQMYQQLQQVTMSNMFKRLDYLFKILEFKTNFNSDFVIKCVDEIVSLITIPEEEKEDK